jgi:hypothetical protein
LIFFRLFPDFFDQQTANKIELTDFTENPNEKFVMALDEQNVKGDQLYSGVLNIILLSSERAYGVIIASVKLLRDNLANWSDQILYVVKQIVKKFHENLLPFLICDAHSAHINMFMNNYKIYTDKMIIKWKWLPELVHVFAYLANILANPRRSIISLCQREGKFRFAFSGKFFRRNVTWLRFRAGAHTRIDWLDKFWTEKFLKRTLRCMDGPRGLKRKCGKVFMLLANLYKRLKSDMKWKQNCKTIFKGMFLL